MPARSPSSPGWSRMPSPVFAGSSAAPPNADPTRTWRSNFAAPATFLNHVVAPARTFATAALPFAEVKQTASALGITINDLVLAMAAGGLRKLLLRYDGRADQPIIASVPTATDRSPDRVTGNEIGGLPVSLPVHVDDAGERAG